MKMLSSGLCCGCAREELVEQHGMHTIRGEHREMMLRIPLSRRGRKMNQRNTHAVPDDNSIAAERVAYYTKERMEFSALYGP
jgi:hypothetical protein